MHVAETLSPDLSEKKLCICATYHRTKTHKYYTIIMGKKNITKLSLMHATLKAESRKKLLEKRTNKTNTVP